MLWHDAIGRARRELIYNQSAPAASVRVPLSFRFLPWLLATAGLVVPAAAADWPALARVAQASTQQQAQAQQEIDRLDDQAQEALADYRRSLLELEGLRTYTAQIQLLVDRQQVRLGELERQVKQAANLDRQIVPLMERMHGGLAAFVAQDLPFLQAERQARTERLRRVLDNPELSMAVRFRGLYEAFQIELDYGRNLETYEDTLAVDGGERAATVLRVGRIGLYALANDRQTAYRWDRAAGAWQPAGDIARSLQYAIRMARKQVAPDLLVLPVDPPRDAS